MNTEAVVAVSKEFDSEEFAYEVGPAVGSAAHCDGLLPPLTWLYRDAMSDPENRTGTERIASYFIPPESDFTIASEASLPSKFRGEVIFSSPDTPLERLELVALADARYKVSIYLRDSLEPKKRAELLYRFASHLYESRIFLHFSNGDTTKIKASDFCAQLTASN